MSYNFSRGYCWVRTVHGNVCKDLPVHKSKKKDDATCRVSDHAVIGKVGGVEIHRDTMCLTSRYPTLHSNRKKEVYKSWEYAYKSWEWNKKLKAGDFIRSHNYKRSTYETMNIR